MLTPTQAMPFILSTDLYASFEGKEIPDKYQAILFLRNGHWIVGVCQGLPLGDFDLTPGQWYLTTLLEKPNQSDGISIDFGQKWQIDSGMQDALAQAVQFLIDYSEGYANSVVDSF